jgi:adenosylcobyric acid synthase
MFASDGFRRAFLAELGAARFAETSFEAEIDRVLDRLADHLENHIDTARLFSLAR